MAIDYLHPNLSSRIIDNQVITVTAQGLTDKFMAFESTKGMPKKLTYVAANSTFQMLYGEPSFRKFGQSGHNITNWLRAGGGVYCMKVSPQNARFASISLGFAKIKTQEVKEVPALPAFAGRAGTRPAVSTLGSGLSPYKLQATTTVGSVVTASFLSNGMPDYANGTTTTGEIVAVESAAAVPGRAATAAGFAVVPFAYSEAYTDITASNMTTITTKKASMLAGFAEAGSTDAEITDHSVEVLRFFPKGIGEYYNNLGVSLTYKEGTEDNYPDWNMFRLDVLEVANGTSVVRESFDVSLDDQAVSESKQSLFISAVVNRYSQYLSCVANFDNVVALADSFSYESVASGVVTKKDEKVANRVVDVMNLIKAVYDIEQSDKVLAEYKFISKASINMALLKTGATTTLPAVTAIPQLLAVEAYAYKDAGNVDVTLPELPFVAGRAARAAVTITQGKLTVKGRNSTIQAFNYAADGAEIFMSGGSNGVWDDSSSTSETPDTLELSLVKAFNGTYDTAVLDPNLVEFDVLLDANLPFLVKKAMVDLATTRQDCLSILDQGLSAATPQDSISIRNDNMDFDTYYAMIFGQSLNVDDEFTGRQIDVTPTYYLANKIVANDYNYGIATNFVGPRRGTIGNYNTISYLPNEVEKEALYKKQINYIERDAIATLFATELTSQKKTTPLSQAHAVRILLRMIRNMKKIARIYKSEYNSSNVQADLQTELNNEGARWVLGAGCDYVVPVVFASDYEKAQRILRVQVNIKFTDLIERIQFDFIVNR